MKKLVLEEFIKISSEIHNYKYDYSLVILKNTNSKIKIICPVHGIFEQSPNNHKKGSECLKCSYKTRKKSNTLTKDVFIDRCNKKHKNKYDYSNLEYINIKTKVNIICPKHGEFKQLPSHHTNGSGCPTCGNDIISKNEFLLKSLNIHGDFYNYDLVNFINTKIKIKIICPKHGEFDQIPYHHMSGSGCPICKESKGEREIRKILINKKIKFISQKRFNDCKFKKTLPFDFYLPELNICIEYDGEQHFVDKSKWHKRLQLAEIQKKDKIKTEYCIKNNIKLIRIKYNQKIETIMNIL